MSSDIERRYTPGTVEVRAAAADKHTIGGYFLKFDRLSQNLGGFVERVAPVALNRARGNGFPDVLARYNHNNDMLLGTTNARTLRVSTDEIGGLYDVDVPESRADVYELTQRGDVSKSSFAFKTIGREGDEWGLTDQNFPLRTLLSLELLDVAPCSAAIAAYPDTSVGLRSLAAHMDAEFEEIRTLAEHDELAKLFIRTDNRGAPKQLFGTSALVDLQSRRTPPWMAS